MSGQSRRGLRPIPPVPEGPLIENRKPKTENPPVIAVLSSASSSGPSKGSVWPGLEPLEREATVRHASTSDQLTEAMREADVLLVTDFRTKIVRDAWPYARRLKWIHATSAGVDMLLFPELVESDVPLTNARGIFDRAIAEYVLGLILMQAKDLPGTLALQRERRWEHRDTERIEGASVLVVGAGSIGRRIGRLCSAAGMRTTGLARRAREDDPDFSAVHASGDLHALLPDADYVVIAAPLTEETRGLIDAAALERMKPAARLINIGRGEIVDTDALVDALRAGRIAGAALDVFHEEPLPADHPLWAMPNVIVSPHMAGDFLGWREALSAQFLDLLSRWKEGGDLWNVVDKQRGYAGPKQTHE